MKSETSTFVYKHTAVAQLRENDAAHENVTLATMDGVEPLHVLNLEQRVFTALDHSVRNFGKEILLSGPFDHLFHS